MAKRAAVQGPDGAKGPDGKRGPYRVVVTFEVADREGAVDLEQRINQTLSERSAGTPALRAAPWIPGAVLHDITGWAVTREEA